MDALRHAQAAPKLRIEDPARFAALIAACTQALAHLQQAPFVALSRWIQYLGTYTHAWHLEPSLVRWTSEGPSVPSPRNIVTLEGTTSRSLALPHSARGFTKIRHYGSCRRARDDPARSSRLLASRTQRTPKHQPRPTPSPVRACVPPGGASHPQTDRYRPRNLPFVCSPRSNGDSASPRLPRRALRGRHDAPAPDTRRSYRGGCYHGGHAGLILPANLPPCAPARGTTERLLPDTRAQPRAEAPAWLARTGCAWPQPLCA